MAEVVVRIPAQLRNLTSGEGEVAIQGATNVGEVLKDLTSRYPELATRIFDEEGTLRRFVNVFVSDEDIRFTGGVNTEVKGGEVVSVVPAVAGGAS